MQKSGPKTWIGKNPPQAISKWRTRLWMFSPIILVLVVLNQMRLVKQYHLNPSKGGAFRMFSTVDHYSTRLLRASAEVDGQEYPIFLNDWVGGRHEIVCMPSDDRLKNELGILIGNKYALIDSDALGDLSGIGTSDPRGQKAYEQVYLSKDLVEDGKLNRSPSFLVDANQTRPNIQSLLDPEAVKVEARRIVYEGEGRFSSRVISSANLSRE